MKTIHLGSVGQVALCLLAVFAFGLGAEARILVATNSTWRYFKGTSEASTPTNVWREVDFDDSAWLVGNAPFHYGTNAMGGDDDLTGGTILSDMFGGYTCLSLRQQFVVPDTYSLDGLWLPTWLDDGLAVWINGQQARNPLNARGFAYTNTATTAREGSAPLNFPLSGSLLRRGTNVLCVQAFNRSLTDNDFRIEVELATHGTIQFAGGTINVLENAGQVVLRVVRTGALDSGMTVHYFTTDGSGLAGSDYQPVSGTLTFADGQTEQTIAVPILNDGLQEPLENFTVSLANPGGDAILVVGNANAVTVQIGDNDKPLQLELASCSVNEDAGEVRIRVLRGDDGDFPMSVDYATANVTATAGQDYLDTAGTMTFEPGEWIKYLIVPLVNDTVREPTQEFRVVLSNASGGGVLGTPSMTTVTITDTDNVVQFGSANYETPEDAAFVEVSLIRGESESVATVDFTTANGTAAAGLDYDGMANTIQFAAGERLKLVNIPILHDGLKEGNETFSLRLSQPTGGAVLGTRSTATATVVDNDRGIGFELSTCTVWKPWGVANISVLRGSDQILGALTVDYSTADGSARAGVDYEAVSGTLEFKANETIRSLTIPLLATPAVGSAKVLGCS